MHDASRDAPPAPVRGCGQVRWNTVLYEPMASKRKLGQSRQRIIIPPMRLSPSSLPSPPSLHCPVLLHAILRLQCSSRLLQLPTMAVIVDLDDETPATHGSSDASGVPNRKPLHHSLVTAVDNGDKSTDATAARPNPNINGFSAALSCYP
jgi:hypothetical protein